MYRKKLFFKKKNNVHQYRKFLAKTKKKKHSKYIAYSLYYVISLQTIVITLNNVRIKFNFVEVYALYYKTDNHNVITLSSLR